METRRFMACSSTPYFANGLGFSIHIRTKIKTWWSYIESAVIRIGDSTLEVQGSSQNKPMQYWIDGGDGNAIEQGALAAVGDFAVTFRKVNDHQSMIRVELGQRDAVSIETFKHFVRVNMSDLSGKKFSGSVGLLGDRETGKWFARDKTTIMKDPNEFGLEWQVLASERNLFHSIGVPASKKCEMPSIPMKEGRRRLGESAIKEEDAALACAHVDEDDLKACIFDVLATNDKDMAGSY